MNIKTNRGTTIQIPILPIVSVIILLVIGLRTMRVGQIAGSEIGVFVNNLTGKLDVQIRPGSQFYCGLYTDFYKIDNTVQSLRLAASEGQKDELNIKTKDGSDVSLDVALNYRLSQDPEMIRTVVIPECGLDAEEFPRSSFGRSFESQQLDSYKVKWVRDYARSVIRYKFGELKTDEFYTSSDRDKKAREAETELNSLLRPHGIEIMNVVPDRFRFYKEYEQKISEKKSADQEVQSQTQIALAQQQSQKKFEVEATATLNVDIAKLEGELKKKTLEIEAEAAKSKLEAEAYAFTVRTGADASLYRSKNEAQSLLARTKAEAEGMRILAASMAGEGGLNLVKLEYAKALKRAQITGVPYAIDSRIQRIELNPESTSSGHTPEKK